MIAQTCSFPCTVLTCFTTLAPRTPWAPHSVNLIKKKIIITSIIKSWLLNCWKLNYSSRLTTVAKASTIGRNQYIFTMFVTFQYYCFSNKFIFFYLQQFHIIGTWTTLITAQSISLSECTLTFSSSVSWCRVIAFASPLLFATSTCPSTCTPLAPFTPISIYSG